MTILQITHIVVFLLAANAYAFGQPADSASNKASKPRVVRPLQRNVIWFTPTRARQINGIALGTLPSSMIYKNDTLKINGLHVEADPLMMIIVPYVIIGSVLSPFIWSDGSESGDAFYSYPDTIRYEKTNNHLSGVNLGLLGSADMDHYKGISISTLVTKGVSLKGISITLGQNNFYSANGLLIAGLMNNVNNGSIVQIGLFNRCKECKGVQIGLLNTFGKRTIPFLNMNF
jgi:hypothetical protein